MPKSQRSVLERAQKLASGSVLRSKICGQQMYVACMCFKTGLQFTVDRNPRQQKGLTLSSSWIACTVERRRRTDVTAGTNRARMQTAVFMQLSLVLSFSPADPAPSAPSCTTNSSRSSNAPCCRFPAAKKTSVRVLYVATQMQLPRPKIQK